jgi:hypothetical protein
MKKTRMQTWTIVASLALVLAACAPASQPPVAEIPPAVAQQAQPAEAAAGAAQPAAAVAAPICATSGTSCTVPDATDTEPLETYCVRKVPYQNILVPDGTTFEVLDRSGDSSCYDQNTFVDGKRVIACTGKELYSFQVKLTNPSCGGSSLATGTGQCQDGYGYDAAQQCCAPLGSDSAGSVTITLNMGACPLPQPPGG